MPNLKNPNELDIAPAQIVGGMRVKQPDSHRVPLKEEQDNNPTSMNENQEETQLDTTNSEEEERLRIRALQERQAQDMQAHTASRQPDVSKNAGNNANHNYVNSYQPRAMNH